jgi:hypothetical protein
MKKYVLLAVLFVVVTTAIVNADTTPTTKVSLMKYSPYPAEPGNYVTLTFKVENTGTGAANNVRLKIMPDYPFSLDSESTVRVGNSATAEPISNDGIISVGAIAAVDYTTVEYKVRVAPDALEGNQPFTVWYQSQSSDSWAISNFNVLVQGTDHLEVADVIPSTLTPGRPTDVVFVLNNSGTAMIRNVVFTWSEKDNTILPLGSGNRKYADSIGARGTAEIPFTLVANPSASSGVYTLDADISYTIGTNISKTMSVNIGMFIGGESDFDVTVQDSASGSVSLSVANVGSNPATSVSVKIPNQRNYVVSGASSSFLGNLNPGDFTLATFQLSSARNFTIGSGPGRTGNSPPSINQTDQAPNTLQVEITYTDTNSNRQVVMKEVPMTTSSGSAVSSGFQSGQFQRQSSGNGINLIIYGIVGVVVVVVLIKYHRRITDFIRKRKK